jgi:hypothetical protein
MLEIRHLKQDVLKAGCVPTGRIAADVRVIGQEVRGGDHCRRILVKTGVSWSKVTARALRPVA